MHNFEDHLNMRIELSKEKLKSKAEILRDSMEILIKRIENNKLKTINTLGEVQGLGDVVDTLCMELGTLLNNLEDYQAFEKLKS